MGFYKKALVDGGSSDEYVTNAIFGIKEGNSFTIGTKIYINNDITLEFIVDFLSHLQFNELNNRSAILFKDVIDGSEGVYAYNLSKSGGTGYFIFSATYNNGIITSYNNVIFLSNITQANKTIIQQYFPSFVLPNDAGWLIDNFNLSTNINDIRVLVNQSSDIINTYSKYISGIFTTDRRMWDSMQFIIDYSVNNILNTPV